MKVEDVFVQNRRLWVRLREKGGKAHAMPCHHSLEEYLTTYLEQTGIIKDEKGPLFRTVGRGTSKLTVTPLPQANAYQMIARRAAAAGIMTNHPRPAPRPAPPSARAGARATRSFFRRRRSRPRCCRLPVHARSISVAGAHILAGQLRDALAARHARAGEVGRARACPLDLHRLIPMPDDLLGRGPDDQQAIAWLWAYWGTTWPLRHVTARPAGAAVRRLLPDGQDGVVLRFHAADWSPWPALLAIRARWPALRFDLQPDYRPEPSPGPESQPPNEPASD